MYSILHKLLITNHMELKSKKKKKKRNCPNAKLQRIDNKNEDAQYVYYDSIHSEILMSLLGWSISIL